MEISIDQISRTMRVMDILQVEYNSISDVIAYIEKVSTKKQFRVGAPCYSVSNQTKDNNEQDSNRNIPHL